MNFNDFSDITLSTNPEQRTICLLVLDCSDSMLEKRQGESRSPLDHLNGALDTLFSAIIKDTLAKRRVELSFVVYGTHVEPPTPFATVENAVFPTLTPSGITSTGKAMNAALDAIEARKQEYKAAGISYTRPILCLISDGLATDSVEEAAARAKQMEAQKKVSIFPIGVDGADLDQLSKFSSRGALALDGMKFDSLFQWLSASAASVSASNPGDAVPLPSPAGWAEL